MVRVVKENVYGPVIIAQVGGDLRLKGRMADDLVVDGDGVLVEQAGEGQPYVIRSGGDCRMMVPENVDVVVQQVGGSAKLSDLKMRLEVQAVGGDLMIRDVLEAAVGAVGGDLRLKRVAGAVQIGAIGGDGTIRDIAGHMHVDRVGADLLVHAIQGSCIVDGVGSDLVLHVDFEPDNEYHFAVGSDVLCWVHPQTSARIIVPLDARVTVGPELSVQREETDDSQILTLGEGAATVFIDAGEDLRLVGDEEDYAFDLGIHIEEEVEARLSSLEEKLSQQLDGLDERISANAAQWASHAERWAERAQEQVEQLADRFSRKFESGRRGPTKRKRGPRRLEFFWDSNDPTRIQRGPAIDPVTEEERLMILQMVQDGKISVEEAERLLAALESQE